MNFSPDGGCVCKGVGGSPCSSTILFGGLLALPSFEVNIMDPVPAVGGSAASDDTEGFGVIGGRVGCASLSKR